MFGVPHIDTDIDHRGLLDACASLVRKAYYLLHVAYAVSYTTG